jgi:hypothetical protein
MFRHNRSQARARPTQKKKKERRKGRVCERRRGREGGKKGGREGRHVPTTLLTTPEARTVS